MMDGQQKPETTLVVDTQTETSNKPDDNVQALASVSDTVFPTSLGGRVRKTTQMFTFTQAKSDEANEFLPPVGKGTKVRDMEFVRNNVEALGKKQQDMMKQLYSIMFGRRFQQKNVKVIKAHILDFSGVIEQDKKSREHLIAKMGKWKLIFVHEVMDFLAVDRSKKSFDEEGKLHNKEGLLERLVDWLYNPQETKLGEKKAVIAAKKAKQKANKRAKAAKKSEIEPAKKKRRTTKKKTIAVEDEGENDHEATESESSSDFEESKTAIMKKKKVTRRLKKSRIVESDNDEDKSENEKNSSADKDELQPTADLQDEANLVDKEEPKSTTDVLDADVCSKIRDIITQGNAEELTVKKIVQQLSADLGRDMYAQKKAIKEFITNDEMKI